MALESTQPVQRNEQGSFYTSAQNAAFETLAVNRFYVLSTVAF